MNKTTGGPMLAFAAAVTVATGAAAGTEELWNNGPLVTYPGEGAGGADVSSISPGLNNFGVNLNQPAFRRADNFTVGAGGWRINTFEAFAYQTGSPTESSMTGLFIRIWSGVPGEGGVVVWGDIDVDLFSSTSWTGIYRTGTAADTFQNTNRPIMSIVGNDLGILLGEGEYWVEWAVTGSLASGPWTPPVSDPVEPIIGNSRVYSVADAAWSEAVEGGNGLGFELAFVMTGETSPETPCTTSTESCTEAHTTPGCSNAACCSQVCTFESFCCDVEWDAFCVKLAIDLCGLYVYECPAGGPANNCPTDATIVEGGDAVAFNSTAASTVGPTADCGSGKGDDQIHNDLWYQFTAPANGTLVSSTCSTADFDTKIALYNIGDGTYDPNDLPALFVACNEDGEGCENATSLLQALVEDGVTYLVRLGGYLGASGSGTISFEFTPEAAACGDPNSGDCCEPAITPFCNDGTCCDLVCSIDPVCCETAWDQLCVNLAFANCPALCGAIPPQECTTPGANPVSSTGVFDGTGGIACAAGGITTPNTYAIVFTQADIGSAYSFNCVNFGLDNGGSYLEGDISVWIDENGGDPSINDVTLVASYPVGLYNGGDQQVTVTGDLQCIELTGDQTLVVTLSIPQATDGFTTFAGAATGFTTYILSDACGIADFATLDSIGFPDNKWWVELSGNDGCDGGGIPGDLNDDGVVNGADLAILAAAWGTADPIADLDGNGVVDGADLSILLSNWSA